MLVYAVPCGTHFHLTQLYSEEIVMATAENAIAQTKSLLDTLTQLQENISNLEHKLVQRGNHIAEIETKLTASNVEREMLSRNLREMSTDFKEEIRKNERLRIHLSQFVGAVERAQKDTLVPVAPETTKEEPEKKAFEPENKGPFYGVHTENGAVIIYPPRECQTTHQLQQFYQLAGLVISPDILKERGGIHLSGLAEKYRHRLKQHYRLKFPHEPKEPEKAVVEEYNNRIEQSATHGSDRPRDMW